MGRLPIGHRDLFEHGRAGVRLPLSRDTLSNECFIAGPDLLNVYIVFAVDERLDGCVFARYCGHAANVRQLHRVVHFDLNTVPLISANHKPRRMPHLSQTFVTTAHLYNNRKLWRRRLQIRACLCGILSERTLHRHCFDCDSMKARCCIEWPRPRTALFMTHADRG